MGIAVAGSSIGGLVHPILLNSLFHQSAEDPQNAFARGVRASAGLVAGLQLIAVLLMRTKYPKRGDLASGGINGEDSEKESHERKPMKLKPMIERFASDWPYVCFVIG